MTRSTSQHKSLTMLKALVCVKTHCLQPVCSCSKWLSCSSSSRLSTWSTLSSSSSITSSSSRHLPASTTTVGPSLVTPSGRAVPAARAKGRARGASQLPCQPAVCSRWQDLPSGSSTSMLSRYAACVSIAWLVLVSSSNSRATSANSTQQIGGCAVEQQRFYVTGINHSLFIGDWF